MGRRAKEIEFNPNAADPQYELLFDMYDGLNKHGKKFLKGRKEYVKDAFCIAFQCGYDYPFMRAILKCNDRYEVQQILTTARRKSEGVKRTAFIQ